MPTGIVTYKDPQAKNIKAGSVATSLSISGLFDFPKKFSLSPSYSYLATDGNVENATHAYLPPNYKITYQQNEFALDLFYKSKDTSRLRFGPGVAVSWWIAAENKDRRPSDYVSSDTRVTRGQSFLAKDSQTSNRA